MTDIFLSYNRDDQARAKLFADGFQSQGFKVWWDTTLRAGEAYDEVTEAALRSAKAVVVLWSQKSVASRWVRAEALLAYRNKTLVPCMLEPCERPIMFELTQSAELFGWKGNRSDPRWLALLGDVKSLIEKNEGVPQDLTPLTSLASPPLKQGLSKRVMLIGVGTVLGTGGLGLFLARDMVGDVAPPSQGRNSVAVLPFMNISGDEGQAYFADGLSAEIRAELAGNSQLRVVAQTSSAVFKVRSSSAQAMARQLGVAFLLDGNVRKAAGTARVNTELIDGKSGISIWTQTFDRPLDDIFAVQSEIATAVVAALVAKLPLSKDLPGKKHTSKPMVIGGTSNLPAYESYLRGRTFFQEALSLETDKQALVAFESAIAIDANYAAAHAWRARALSVLASQSGDPALIRVNHRSALAAAQKAVELAPTFAHAYSALGFVLFTNALDARAAKPAFDKSLQYGAGDGDILLGFAMFCGRTGRKEEAASAISQTIELDPLNPTAFRCAGQVAAMARKYDEALVYFQRAITMNPKASTVQALKGGVLYETGKFDDARVAFEAEPNRLFGLQGLAMVEQKQGRKQQAQVNLAKLLAEFGDSGLYQQAQVHAAWGDKAQALATLERAYVVGDPGLSALYTDPVFDEIRQESRFSQLLKTIGFE